MTVTAILHIVRESEVSQWFDVGWAVCERPHTMPGQRIIEWRGEGRPVAPFIPRTVILAERVERIWFGRACPEEIERLVAAK